MEFFACYFSFCMMEMNENKFVLWTFNEEHSKTRKWKSATSFIFIWRNEHWKLVKDYQGALCTLLKWTPCVFLLPSLLSLISVILLFTHFFFILYLSLLKKLSFWSMIPSTCLSILALSVLSKHLSLFFIPLLPMLSGYQASFIFLCGEISG